MTQRFFAGFFKICAAASTYVWFQFKTLLYHIRWQQFPIEPQVTEYVQYMYRCKDCGELIYQSLPDELKRKHFGPGTLSVVGILTGFLNTSKCKALAILNEVFSVPMSLGGLSNCEAQLADALQQAYNETAEHVRC